MSVIKKISEGTALIISYFIGAPNDHVLHPVNTILSTTFSISQSVIDESAKALFALMLTLISRWIYNRFDRPKKKRYAPRKNIKPAPLPDSLTLNNKCDEKVNEKIQDN